MTLSRSFRETVVDRARRDPAFRAALVEEALQTMIEGDFETAKTMLGDCIKAVMGFEDLSDATHIDAKSLIRMVGPKGNPTATNLFAIIGAVQKRAGVVAHVQVEASGEQECAHA
jgi:DNA-binding phage protein